MSQMNSRRQELLSRLKTTLAIVSQATGFDNERATGDARPAEHQWNLGTRDPRIRRQETYQEAPGVSEPGSSAGSGAVTSTARASAGPSSNLFHKCDEIQDEDEFLYGSTTSAHSSRQQVPAADSGQDKRSDEHQDKDMRLQWVSHRQAREEETHWTDAPASRQPSYTDPPQAVSRQADDPRWPRNTEATAVGQTLNQSQWMQPSSSKGDDGSWGGASSVSRYSDVDHRQSMGRGPEMAPANVGLRPESIAGKLQGINTGMLEGILKLVASGTAKSASQPLQQPQLPLQQHQQPLQQPLQPMQQHQQPLQQPLQPLQQHQQPLQQPHLQSLQQQLPSQQPQQFQQQPLQHPHQPLQQQPLSFESHHAYGSSYPPQHVYSQFPDRHGYMSSGVPRHMSSDSAMYAPPIQPPQSTYNYNQPASQQCQGSDVSPLFNQLATAFLDSSMTPTSSQPAADRMQSLAGMMEQVGARNPPTSYRPVVTSVESQFARSQLVERPLAQPDVMAGTLEKPQTPGMQSPYPVGRDAAGPEVASHVDRATAAEPDKGKGGLPKSDADKDTLSRLLNMIGCSSNVTSLMQELLKKDEQDKMMGKQQTSTQPDSSAALPAAQPPEPQTKENDSIKVSTASVLQTQPEPASTHSKPETKPVLDEKTQVSLPSEPAKGLDIKPNANLPPEPAKESETGEMESTIQVLSSLSRLQKNYDSPDENADKDSGLADENGSKKSLSVAKDDEWERSTDEFLRRLQSKTAAPPKSQKEKSRSTSRDKTTKDGQKTTTDNEMAELLGGKREIENALEMLQTELANLRTNKKRLLESPSGAQRDANLEKSIENERNLTDHMLQLKNSMAELNKHVEKLSSVKV